MTAVGNDYGFEHIFARQLPGVGQRGDVAVAISTSGNSENVLRAVKAADDRSITSAAFTGSSGGKLLAAADICLRVPSDDTARIQEAHITAAHIICELVETALA